MFVVRTHGGRRVYDGPNVDVGPQYANRNLGYDDRDRRSDSRGGRSGYDRPNRYVGPRYGSCGPGNNDRVGRSSYGIYRSDSGERVSYGHAERRRRHDDRRGERSRSPLYNTYRPVYREDRNRPSGVNTYYGTGQRERGGKPRDKKRGNLSAENSKTNAAVKIIIGQLSKAYMQKFELPVHYSEVFELNKNGESTAQFLDKSWQKPKEKVHEFWRRYKAAAVPTKEFFEQNLAVAEGVPPPPSDPTQQGQIKQETVDDNSVLMAMRQAQN